MMGINTENYLDIYMTAAMRSESHMLVWIKCPDHESRLQKLSQGDMWARSAPPGRSSIYLTRMGSPPSWAARPRQDVLVSTVRTV